MRHRKYLIVMFLTIFGVFTSCQKDEIDETDSLEQIGILGKWELQSITINGITDMSIRYDTNEFIKDSEIGDLKGECRSIGAGYETIGQFELDTANNIIHFDFNNTQKSYEFQIKDDIMIFTYSESNQEIIEDWRKKK